MIRFKCPNCQKGLCVKTKMETTSQRRGLLLVAVLSFALGIGIGSVSMLLLVKIEGTYRDTRVVLPEAVKTDEAAQSAPKDQDKDAQTQFLIFFQKKAQDPSDVQILEWGKLTDAYHKKELGRETMRSIKVRSKIIAYAHTQSKYPRGTPVSVDDATIYYRDGKISYVVWWGINTQW